MHKSAIFISYRREDCTGYAGRLEDALERAFGTGTVFRDMRDIAAGERFADVIESCLSTTHAVLVLIGPRWLGSSPDGSRRIDDEGDFVRLEVATALASGCKVVPILLAGAGLPRTEELPDALATLTRHQALSLHETSWDADVQRLIEALGLPSVRRRRLLVATAALTVLVLGGGAAYLIKPAPVVDPAAAAADGLIGTWEARVQYAWGDAYAERFVFQRFAGTVTGTASFLEYPRGIEDFTIDGNYFSFVTHTVQSMDAEERELTHRYVAELDGGAVRFRLQTSGGFVSYPPLEFTAHLMATAKQQADGE